jgi:hypothetical protein
MPSLSTRLCRELHILNMGRLGRKKAKLFINFNPACLTLSPTSMPKSTGWSKSPFAPASGLAALSARSPNRAAATKVVLDRLVSGLRSRLFKIAVDDFGADDSDSKEGPISIPTSSSSTPPGCAASPIPAGMGLLKLMVEQFIERGITVLFEGLEEDHQIDFCNEIGVQLMQGYALARPEIVPTTFDERFPRTGADAGRRSGPALLRNDTARAEPARGSGQRFHAASTAGAPRDILRQAHPLTRNTILTS